MSTVARRSLPSRFAKWVAGAAVAALAAATLTVVSSAPASAVTQESGSRIYADQLFYAYVAAGESLDVSFQQTTATQPVTITVLDPAGVLALECEVPASAPNGVTCSSAGLASTIAGVWKITFDVTSETGRYLSDIVVRDAGGAEITGRTWTDVYSQYQSSASIQDYWVATREGYLYGIEMIHFNGVGSALRANGFGLVEAGTCNSIYRSVDGTSIGANGVWLDPAYENSDACGDPYWLFFERPDAALPASAPSADGTLWVRPAVVPASAANLQFTASDPLTRAGQITFDLTGVNGGYTVQVDTDANGVYTDAVDRIIPWGSPPGAITVPFDGLDGLGNAIGVCQPMNAQVVVDRVGEMHLVLEDVEQLGNGAGTQAGLRLTGETPITAPNPQLYWDDRGLDPVYPGEPFGGLDGRAGFDTSTLGAETGIHGWRNDWGDRRSIENWTYYQATAGAQVAIAPPCDPAMTIDKRASLDDTNSNGRADADEEITYTFLVSNTGNADLFDVVIDDPQVTGVTPASADIPQGMTQLFTAAPYTVTQADVDAGGVSNVAVARGEDPTGGDVESPPDNTFVPGPDRDPRLTIVKSADFVLDAGDDEIADLDDELEYTFVVTNIGNTTLTDVTVVDDRVASVTPASVTLAPGASQTFTSSVYVVSQDDLNTGAVDNSAIATGTSPIGDVESPPDTTTVLTPVPDPLLELVKTGVISIDVNSDGFADVGDTIEYTFVVTNTGNVDLDDVEIVDPKVGATSPASTDIGADGSAIFTATYVVQQSDVDHGSVDNVATARGTYLPADDPAVTVTSSPDDATVPTPARAPELEIVKTGTLNDTNSNGFADVGETIDYEFTVTNTGNTTLTGVEVLDARLSGLSPASVTLLPEEFAVFGASPYTVTQADVDAGAVLNSATTRGHIPGGPEVTSPPDEFDVPGPPPAPAIEFVKQGALDDTNGNGRADEGEQIVYSFDVTNAGNVTLADVTVDDEMLEGLLPAAIDILPPGGVITLTADAYTVTAADEEAGEIVNVAFAFALLPDGSTVIESDEDDVVIPAGTIAGPGLAATGTDLGGPFGLAILAMLAGAAVLGLRRVRRASIS